MGEVMFAWFRNKALEKDAAARAAIRNLRAAQAQRERDEIMAEIDGISPGAVDGVVPFHRSPDEARAYRFALDLIRRRGPSEASRIADLVVRNVQMLSRDPR